MFSKEGLISQITEAEKLVAYIKKNQNLAGQAAIFRWAIVADEVTAFIQQAQEHLEGPELAALKDQVYTINPAIDLWAIYANNPRRARAIFGRELYEQPSEIERE